MLHPTVFDTSQAWPGVFATPHLQASPLADGDAALFAMLYGDPDTMHHVGPVLDREAAWRGFSAARAQMRAQPPRARYWRLDADGGAVGLLSLVVDPVPDCAETGVLLAGDGRGRGFAAEALSGLLSQVLRESGLCAVWTRHRPGHAAAVGLMRGLRFEAEGMHGPWSRWRMTRARWRALVGERGGD